VKINFKLAAVLFAVLIAGGGWAQTKTQPAGQAPAQPKPSVATPAQTAKPPVKAEEQNEPIPPVAPNALFPAVVARVNGKNIIGRDLELRVRSELATIGSPSWKDLRDDYKSEVIGRQIAQLISNELVYQKAISAGVAVTSAEVQAEFDKVAKSYANDAALNTELANRGMDRASLTRELSKNLIVEKFIQDTIAKKLVVTPQEVTDYYNGNLENFKHPDVIRSSHILILVPEGATEEQRATSEARAAALAERAKKGEDFAKLAKENSMDDSASQGGDIGLTKRGDLASEYEQAADKLKVGDVSGVVKTQFGYHIIKLTDRKLAGTATLDEVKTELTQYLKDQKEQAEVEKLVKTLQSAAKIEVLIKY
jgi:peptidyl-prolyl cis-trans isomerase C